MIDTRSNGSSKGIAILAQPAHERLPQRSNRGCYSSPMLLALDIRNLAVLESLSIRFAKGLTAITGETGAGKSILIDALTLLSGARTDLSLIREGADRCEVSAEFAPPPGALEWLREMALDEDEQCVLKRVLKREGGSRAYINGRGATASQLADLSALLLDIHGQNEHQSLLKRSAQLDTLDALAGALALRDELKDIERHASAINAERASIGGDDAAALREFVRFQLDELNELDPTPERFDALNSSVKRAAALEGLRELAGRALSWLDGAERPLLKELVRLESEFQKQREIEPRFAALPVLLEQAHVNLREAQALLEPYLDDAQNDPQAQREVERTLDRWHELARKHRIAASALADKRAALAARLAELDGAESRLAELTDAYRGLAARDADVAARLSALRTTAARALGERVEALLKELKMGQARFEVALEPNEPRAFDPLGRERVEFRVSFNAGEPLKPLRKVASGGELSRMGLCLSLAAIESVGVPLVVFDEVDAGVGGAVAERIGRLLRELGMHVQVFTVTHLPQVAACANQQLSVRKTVRSGRTQTSVDSLDEPGRIDELARMLGGEALTELTRAHAREMLGRSSV
jgi:DNA repair protein RecN (Recombination protein N)